MKRRQFLALLGAAGAARLAWPIPADDEEMVIPPASAESGLILLNKLEWCEVLAVEVFGTSKYQAVGEAWIGTLSRPRLLSWNINTHFTTNMLWVPMPEERIVTNVDVVVGASPGLCIEATMNDHGALRQLVYQS